jgi:transmembrane sensor
MEPISEQAARWAVRSLAESFGAAEQRDLAIWLDADPRHRGAYVRARAQWADLDRLAALHGPAEPAMDEPPASHTTPQLPRIEQIKIHSGLSRRRLLGTCFAAASVAGLGLAGLAIRSSGTRYSSGIGEIRRIALDDGSTMVLNTATDVIVKFSKKQRMLRLTRGEALFEVAHDTARPFIVQAIDTVIRAVGTAFAVRLESTRLNVTVTEGVVEVTSSSGLTAPGPAVSANSVSKRVAANERIVFIDNRVPEIQPVSPSESERELAWRDGMVSFNGESLQIAVAEINRHNRRHIIIDDPELAAAPIVGVFRATDFDGFSAAAASALKAAEVPDGNDIHLTRRHSKL